MHLDPRRALPLGAAIVGSVVVASTTIYVYLSGGYRYVDVPKSVAVPTVTQRKLVKLAKDYGPKSGILYVWGGSSRYGFDCSGYTSFVAKLAGVNNVPRTSFSQFNDNNAIRVPRSDLRPGDFVFFKSYGSYSNPGHVGMYIGNGQLIEYYRSGYPARLNYLSQHRDYAGARRWWHPVHIRKKIWGTAVWVARHWGVRIANSTHWTVTYVPALGHHRFDKAKRARIVKWAHLHHHRTSGNRTYLNIKLYH